MGRVARGGGEDVFKYRLRGCFHAHSVLWGEPFSERKGVPAQLSTDSMPGADAAVQINRGRRHAPTSCSRLRRRRPCRLRHRLYLSGRLRRLLLRTAFGRLLRLRLRCALRQHLWLPALLAWRPGHRIRLRLRRLRVRVSLWLPRRWLSLLPAILVVSPASAPPARKKIGREHDRT